MLRALREQNRIISDKKVVTEDLAKSYIKDYNKDLDKYKDRLVKLTKQVEAKSRALEGYKHYLSKAAQYGTDLKQCEKEKLWDKVRDYFEAAQDALGEADEFSSIITSSYLIDSEIKVPKW